MNKSILTRSVPTSLLGVFSSVLIMAVKAEITVDNSVKFQGANPTASTFNAFGSDKIVVISTGEHGFNQTANGDGGLITFDGVELIQAVNRNPIKPSQGPPVVLVDDTWNDLWYLDAADFPGGVFPDSELPLSAVAVTRASVTVIALSGTAPGVGNTVIGDRDSNAAELSTSAGSIVITSYGLGGSGNTAQLNTITTPETMEEVSRHENGNNWDGHVVAYANGVAAGTSTYSFLDTKVLEPDGRTGRHVIAAEFLSGDGVSGLPLMISDINYASSTNEVTLTWPKTGAAAFNIELSSDLLDWDTDLGSGITDASDEDTDDAENITITLPLPLGFEGTSKLFFRVEEAPAAP